MDEVDEVAQRSLTEPALSRLPLATPHRAEILAAHAASIASGAPGYLDPATELFVLNATFLAERRRCCTRGCRHCPYVNS